VLRHLEPAWFIDRRGENPRSPRKPHPA
jgi:hypothetical protein